MFQSDNQYAEQRAQQALRLAHELSYAEFEAHALVTLSILARTRGDLGSAISLSEDALRLGRDLGDVDAKRRALNNLSTAYQQCGEWERPRQLLEESLSVATRRGDRRATAHCLHLLGNVAAAQGEYARAAKLLEESLVQWQTIDADYGRHWILLSLGLLVHRQGDVERARALMGESLQLCRQSGDRPSMAKCLDELAGVAATTGQPARAVRLLAASDALRELIGAPRQPTDRTPYERTLAVACAELGVDECARAAAEGRAVRLEDAIADAEALATPSFVVAVGATRRRKPDPRP
jgi:tetratricopeptide (TPR) repeat protein